MSSMQPFLFLLLVLNGGCQTLQPPSGLGNLKLLFCNVKQIIKSYVLPKRPFRIGSIRITKYPSNQMSRTCVSATRMSSVLAKGTVSSSIGATYQSYVPDWACSWSFGQQELLLIADNGRSSFSVADGWWGPARFPVPPGGEPGTESGAGAIHSLLEPEPRPRPCPEWVWVNIQDDISN